MRARAEATTSRRAACVYVIVLLEAVAQLVQQHLLVRRVALQRLELVDVELALVQLALQPPVLLLHQLYLLL